MTYIRIFPKGILPKGHSNFLISFSQEKARKDKKWQRKWQRKIKSLRAATTFRFFTLGSSPIIHPIIKPLGKLFSGRFFLYFHDISEYPELYKHFIYGHITIKNLLLALQKCQKWQWKWQWKIPLPGQSGEGGDTGLKICRDIWIHKKPGCATYGAKDIAQE